jgi:hypothetical protein
MVCFEMHDYVHLCGIFSYQFIRGQLSQLHKSPDSEKITIDNSLALSIRLFWQLSYDVVIEQMSAKVI